VKPVPQTGIVAFDAYCTADLLTRYATGRGLTERFVVPALTRVYNLGRRVRSPEKDADTDDMVYLDY